MHTHIYSHTCARVHTQTHNVHTEVYRCTHTQMHRRTHAHAHTHTHTHTQCTHTQYTSPPTHTHTDVQTNIHTDAQTYTHTDADVRIHMRIRITAQMHILYKWKYWRVEYLVFVQIPLFSCEVVVSGLELTCPVGTNA